MSICSQGEALGGIAERPLTTRIRIISGVAGHQRCSAAAYDGESWGSGGIAPGSPGAGAVAPAGCGQSPRFVLVIKRKLPSCGRTFLLIHYAEIFLSRVVPLSLPRLRLVSICSLFPLDNIRLFSRSVDKRNPGFEPALTVSCKSQTPQKEKKRRKFN